MTKHNLLFTRRLSPFIPISALILGLGLNPSRAAEFLGAATVLQKASAEPNNPKPKKANPITQLKEDFETFQKQLSGMAPDEMAAGWLRFADRFASLDRDARYSGGPREALNYYHLFGVLPPPKAWDALEKQVLARPLAKGPKAVREIVLRLLVHTLNNKPEAQRKDIAELEALAMKGSEIETYQIASLLEQFDEALLESSDDANTILRILERQLKQRENAEYRQDLRIPDLVSLLGREKAEAFLRRALVKNVQLSLYEGEETKTLARQLALELVKDLKKPQWNLADSLDATVLYEAMEKQFSREADTETNGVPDLASLRQGFGDPKQVAQSYYLLGLIVSDRTKEAAALAQQLGKSDWVSLPEDALKSLERAGHTVAIHNFFKELLTQNPGLPFWEAYIGLAAKTGETASMLEMARKAASEEDLSKRKRTNIKQQLYRALLAADHIDEGVAQLRLTFGSSKDENTRNEDGELASAGVLLARLGSVLNRPAWMEEGIGVARSHIAERTGRTTPIYVAVNFAKFLQESGRGPEAEAVLAELLTQMKLSKNETRSFGNNQEQTILVALAGLYHKAGRHQDVLILLDEAAGWEVKDLAEMRDLCLSYGMPGDREDPVAFFAAAALSNAGKKDEAKKLIESILDSNPGFDPAYELLLKVEGDGALSKLEALFARDQFEERPLIWKAVLLQRANKLEEAEKIIRQAISIDPSDGEQGPGRRLRAYAVLAEIRAARGDEKEAEFLRGAVRAIRLSEKADRFYEAGLLKQAVKMYEDSLALFSDAYCIQSRVALRMADLGLHEQAEEHYRRAYELMPDSFGRVESHCFGCERAFDGQRAQGIAEKVFTNLAKKSPEKPQIHYLLGYLREEQGRNREALVHYREAVRLDPDYLNAWKHIESVGSQLRLPSGDRSSVALNLLRLDPLGRHGSPSFREVKDLRVLWDAVADAAKLQIDKPKSLYVLAASKAQLEKKEQTSEGRERMLYSRQDNEREKMSPARAILQNPIVQPVASILTEPIDE